MNDDSGDLSESSTEGLTGQKSVAEVIAAQYQKAGHILHIPRLRNDWRRKKSELTLFHF